MTNRNPRDIHGDGHGFVDVPIGRRPKVVTVEVQSRWNYDLTKMPTSTEHPFVGLYQGRAGEYEARLVIRAVKPHHGLGLMSYENAHYMTDPLAFYEIPKW
jgi:hypothetical protein